MAGNSQSPKRSARQVGELLNSESKSLGKLLSHARQLQFLDQKLAGLLEPEMCAQVQVAAMHDECLVLLTPSAALATRLKMDSDSLLNSLKASGVKGLSQIKVRTAPITRTKKETRHKRQLPECARLSLERFAYDSGDEETRDLILKHLHRDRDN